MSEPPDNADPKPDDELSPLDAELVTDPLAIALGAAVPRELDLPEPVLGVDEDEPAGHDTASNGGARPPFLGMAREEPAVADDSDELAPAAFDDPPAFDAEAADMAAAGSPDADVEDAETPDAAPPAPAGDPPGPLMTQADGRSRRVWREIRLAAFTHEKVVAVAPPPVVDADGRVVRKYMFERSFDLVDQPPEPEPEPEPEPILEPIEVIAEEPPPPVFSEAELAATRAAGYAEGEAAGRQAAGAAAEARIAELMQHIAALVPGLAKDRDQAVSAVSHEAARLAHAMVRRMLPELARRYRVEEIEAVVVDSLNKALDQPRMIIRVPAEVAGYLGDRLETVARQQGFAGRVLVLSDQTLGASDVRVEWGDGGAERCVQRAWGELESTVQRVVAKLEQVAPVAEIPEGASEDTIGSAA
jgi:flagellar assembly protein FliH